ncbi:hypothetical protein [Lysobacter humi (ex Lee et al. 2017)]
MSWRTLFGATRIPGDDPCGALPQLLSDALNVALRPVKADGGVAELLHLPAEELLNVDRRLRAYRGAVYAAWSPHTLRHIASCPVQDEMRHALLFIACAQPDGRERQKAVWRLADFPAYLTLAAALVRCDDWAAPVRFAARDAVVRLLPLCQPVDVLAAWPLVLRLQKRKRAGDPWLEEAVEGWMLLPANAEVLRAALASNASVMRHWAYCRAIDRGGDLWVSAVLQPDPRIGLYALVRAQTALDPVSLGDLAKAGLRAPHPVIRRESLRTLSGTDQAAAASMLPSALLDRSAGVRRLAAYLMRQKGLDPRLEWRSALDRAGLPFPLGALASLSEAPEEEDDPRFRPLLTAARSQVRQLALRGVLHLSAPISPAELAGLLDMGGRRVIATLADAVRESAIWLDNALILSVLASGEARQARLQHLRTLLCIGGLWDRLDQLLALHVPPEHTNWWLAAVDDWIRRSDTYAPIGDMRKRDLLAALATRATELQTPRVSRAAAALQRYS